MSSYPHTLRDWLLRHERYEIDDENGRRPVFLFAGCIIFYCFYMLLMQPEWVLGGGMWAESATNYFRFASSSSFVERFFSTDVGYIPLPQRILASIGDWLRLPAISIAYYYTWSGLLLTASLVGAFCLAPFRPLIRNDWLRCLACIAILMVVDFETRTFINFTYFAAFLVASITALALVERQVDVPRWAWLIPILMMSKPAVLSALPGMVLVAFTSKTRFRLITIAASLMCLVQLAMLHSTPLKPFSGAALFSFVQKVEATVRYFLGFLGSFVVGKSISLTELQATVIGTALLIFCLSIVATKRNNACVLIPIGLCLLFFNITLHCFAMSSNWNIDMQRLENFHIERHIVVGYSGVILIVTGTIGAFIAAGRGNSWKMGLAPSVFVVWFLLSGWFSFSATLNQAPPSPKLGNSQWREMAAAIDSGQDVCVPVDPLGVFYTKNCGLINRSISLLISDPRFFAYKSIPNEDSRNLVLELPQQEDKQLRSVAILIRPHVTQAIAVEAQTELILRNGEKKFLAGSRTVPATGGLLTLTDKDVTRLGDIVSAKVHFSVPVDIGFVRDPNAENLPIILWMGH